MIGKPSNSQEEPDELIIRFRRQTYYADEHTYNAQIIRSPIPLQGGDFRADMDVALNRFATIFEDLMQVNRFYPYEQPPSAGDPLLEAGRETLTELGSALYDLLPLAFRDGLLRWIQSAYVQGRSARLVLEAQLGEKGERLLALPWELLYAPDAGFQPGRSPRFSIERRLIGTPLRALAHLQQPARLIHLIASDKSRHAIEEGVIEWERTQLPRLAGAGNYQRVSEPGSVAGLIAAQRQQAAHILHFLGHGLAAREEEGGHSIRSYLEFVGEDGQIQHVTGEQLQQLLHDGPGLQMVVLTACYTGTATQNNIAYDLVASGFPYVVAMQSAMPQPATGHFIQRFYEELQNGHPPDRAVAAGRHAIAVHFPGALDWCLPVLYSGAGLSPRSRTLGWIDGINRWLTQAFFQRIWRMTGGMAVAHLTVALLLWLSDVTFPRLDGFFLGRALGWLIPASLAVTLWYLFRSARDMEDAPANGSKWALLLRVWGATAASIGLLVFSAGYFSIGLLAGLGFWSVLSPFSQIFLLIPVALIAMLVSIAQAHNHAQGFINGNRVQKVSAEWGDMLFVVVGALLVLLPLLLTYFAPTLLAPPLLNLLIGLLNLALAVLLHKDR